LQARLFRPKAGVVRDKTTGLSPWRVLALFCVSLPVPFLTFF